MTTSSSSPGDELEKLAEKIIKIAKQIKKDVNNMDLSHLSPEEAEAAKKMLEGFKYMIEKKNLELWRIWQKIEQAEEDRF